jgi:hypothetical protein
MGQTGGFAASSWLVRQVANCGEYDPFFIIKTQSNKQLFIDKKTSAMITE